MNNKIFLVISFEEAYYDSEKNFTYLKAISNNLDELCEEYRNQQIGGNLIIIDSSLFNKFLLLDLSSNDFCNDNIQKHDFNKFVKFFLKNKDKLKT
jgi:hypothetical protein